jgi:hypothetical protein
MFLHELPAVLVEDIITEAASEMGLYRIFRFREVKSKVRPSSKQVISS